MTDTLNGSKTADSQYPIAPLLAERWSPRALDVGHEISVDELGSLLEAARWTPSCFNSQPWRFVVARRGSQNFGVITATLTGNNPLWAPAASALIVICALNEGPEGKPLPWGQYDTGQAAAHMTIQAESMGLSVHQMDGFRREELHVELSIPAHLTAMAIMAVGHHDPAVALPDPLQDKEQAVRVRQPLSDLVLDGWPPSP
jgi:nitroreductase